jgi:glutaredoxin
MKAVLYTKPDCSLCRALEATLREVAKRRPLAFDVIDVSHDPDLLRRYGPDLPVLVIGDAVFRHWASARAIERVLAEKEGQA